MGIGPMRTCVGCRKVASVENLIRVTASLGHGGRGAWLHFADDACFDTAVRRSAFRRALRSEVDEEWLGAVVTRLYLARQASGKVMKTV